MVHVDEYFNEINLPNPNDTLKNIHSASSLLDENNKSSNSNKNINQTNPSKAIFTLNPEDENESKLADDIQRKLQMNNVSNKRGSTIEPSPSALSLPVNSTYDLSDVFEIWRAPPLPSYSNDVIIILKKYYFFFTLLIFDLFSLKYYNFNFFTMCLNEMKDEFKDKLAPTDSRFRQDIRNLELGNLGKKKFYLQIKYMIFGSDH
jgi:hypothetical protein